MADLHPVCSGCQRTVYLLDDGKDKKKRKWASRLGPDVVYVSGRHRAPDESNGKSGNLNNALTQIYPDGIKIPPHEIVCIMDADQVRGLCSARPCPRCRAFMLIALQQELNDSNRE